MSKPSQIKRTASGPSSNLLQPTPVTAFSPTKPLNPNAVSPTPAPVLSAPPNAAIRRSYAELRRSEEHLQHQNEHLRRQLEEMGIKVSILENQLNDQFASHGDAVATVQEAQHKITQLQLLHTQERQRWLQERMKLEEDLLDTRSQLNQAQKEVENTKKNADRRVHALLREFEVRGVDAVTLDAIKKESESGNRYLGVFPAHSYAYVKATPETQKNANENTPSSEDASFSDKQSSVPSGQGKNTELISGQNPPEESLSAYLTKLRENMHERQRDMKQLMERLEGRRLNSSFQHDSSLDHSAIGAGATHSEGGDAKDIVDDVFKFAFNPEAMPTVGKSNTTEVTNTSTLKKSVVSGNARMNVTSTVSNRHVKGPIVDEEEDYGDEEAEYTQDINGMTVNGNIDDELTRGLASLKLHSQDTAHHRVTAPLVNTAVPTTHELDMSASVAGAGNGDESMVFDLDVTPAVLDNFE